MTEDAEQELEKLVESHEDKAAEDKWRTSIVTYLRSEADRIERGGKMRRVYTVLEDWDIESADSVREASAAFAEGDTDGDEWGVYVPIQWRKLEVKGAKCNL